MGGFVCEEGGGEGDVRGGDEGGERGGVGGWGCGEGDSTTGNARTEEEESEVMLRRRPVAESMWGCDHALLLYGNMVLMSLAE